MNSLSLGRGISEHSFLREKKKSAGAKFPFFRRGGFFCDSKKRRGSVGRHGKMPIRATHFRVLVADTTPPAIAGTPSARRGIVHRELLPTLPRHFVPPLLQEGELCTENCYRHYPALASPATPSTRRGIQIKHYLPPCTKRLEFYTMINKPSNCSLFDSKFCSAQIFLSCCKDWPKCCFGTPICIKSSTLIGRVFCCQTSLSARNF